MNNIQSYDDYLNEGLVDDFKSKISSWWNNFQNKETVIRKIHIYINNGAWIFLFLYLCGIIARYIPGFIGDTMEQIIKSNRTTILWGLALFYILNTIDRTLMFKMRPKAIQKKMEELRQQFANKKYLNYYTAVLGDKKDIKAVLKRLKDDEMITDANIIELPDVTLIDFSGTHYLNMDQHEEIDPLGEEDWGDNTFDRANSASVKLTSLDLQSIYNVRFRQIEDVIDYMDKKSIFTKKHDDKDYKSNVEEIKMRRFERELPHDHLDLDFEDDDDNWVDEPNPQHPDRDYIAYNRGKEKQEPKPNKYKKARASFRNKFNNFAVPGFNVEPPKIMDRE